MSLKKKYLKNKTICKVGFRVHKKDAKDAKRIFLVGDFNNWHKTATPMKPLKNGDFIVTMDLKAGREYQFRYFFCFYRLCSICSKRSSRYTHQGGVKQEIFLSPMPAIK